MPTQLGIAKQLEKRRRTRVERSKISHDAIAYQATIRRNIQFAAAAAERERIATHVRHLQVHNPHFVRARMEMLDEFLSKKES